MAGTKKRVKNKTGVGGVHSAKAGSSSMSEAGEVVKFDETGMPTLDVWLEDETIWLTQKQMGLLFGVMEHTITYHIRKFQSLENLRVWQLLEKFE